MSIVYGDFTAKVLRLLGDPDGQLFEDDIIWDAAVAAHEAVLPWIPKYAEHTFTAGSSGGDVYSLPVDCYQIQAVQTLSDGKFLPKATLAPNTARNISTTAIDWIEYPFGSISLSSELSENEEVRLYYFAFWNAPTSESDSNFVLEVPQMAYIGMVYYAGSHCLLPKAVDSAQIRQFNQRIDSGNPEHNPLKVEARYLLERFYAEMKMMPPYTRVPQT